MKRLPPVARGAEFFLSRTPTDEELPVLQEALTVHFADMSPTEVPLSNDLGSLYVGLDEPGMITLDPYGEPPRSRIGAGGVVITEGVKRHLSVRIAYTDERAERVLRTKARQLPPTGPGLVMVQTAGATGADRAWPGWIESRFAPEQHTRVSGVVLFGAYTRGVQGGRDWVPHSVLIENPYASTSLPDFVSANPSRWSPYGER